MNVIITLTLFVAYLFFFLVCCYIEDGLLGLSSFALKDMDKSVIYEGQTSWSNTPAENKVPRETFEKFFSQYDFIEDVTIVEYDNYFDSVSGRGVTLYLIDENYDSHFNFPIIMGRYFTDEEIESGAKVCVIGEERQLKTGLVPGDTLEIGGTSLEIVGVMKYNANMGANLTPYNAFGDKFLTRTCRDIILRWPSPIWAALLK